MRQIGIKRVIIHLLVWIVLISLNFIVISNYGIDFNKIFNLLTWALFIALFYLNYSLLMPLFFRRKFLIYVPLAIMSIGLFSTLKFRLDHKHFEQRMEQKHRFSPRDKPRAFNRFNENNAPENFEIVKDNPPKPPTLKKPGFLLRFPPISFYSMMLIWLSSMSVSLFQKWQDDDKRKKEIQQVQVLQELSFLKQQVNPHFLFNALNNIYSLTLNTSKPASSAILKLSSILRYMLYETENKWVDLYDELHFIGDYIDLQKLRLTNNTALNYSVTGDSSRKKIAPLLLIPLIENAFKHGVDNVSKGHITISLDIGVTTFEAFIENTTFKKSPQTNSDLGIGIKNIKRRLELLYPERHSLEIREEDGIFKVHLVMQLGIYKH